MKSDSMAMVRRTLRMAWPAVLESVFVAMAGLIDTMMVSALGPSAVAAVGLTQQPKFIGLSPFFAINVALSAIMARRRGEDNRKNAGDTFVTALCMILILCVLVTFLCVTFSDALMHLAGSSEDTHQDAAVYFRIIMGGTFFSVISMMINAAQRGTGNTRISMTTNVTSSLVNILFNYLLIGGHWGFPAMGVTGAALATVLGTVVAMFMSIFSLFRKTSYLRAGFLRRCRPDRTCFLSLVKLGSNMFAENLAMRVGFVATAVMAAGLGTQAFAAHNVGMNFLSLGFSFGDGMQAAAVTLSGQSIGAGEKQEAIAYGRICQRVGLVISLMLSMVLLFLGRFLYGLYFSEDPLLDMGVLISRFSTVIVILQISQIIYGGCLRAGGDVRYTLIASLVSVTLIRTLVTLVCTQFLNMGLSGIWLGVLADQLSRFILLSLRFRKGQWVNYRV